MSGEAVIDCLGNLRVFILFEALMAYSVRRRVFRVSFPRCPIRRSFSGACAEDFGQFQKQRVSAGARFPYTLPEKKPGDGGLNDTLKTMTGLLIGYARVSTNDQDLTAQKNALLTLGVSPEKTFTDQGLTGANRARPGLGKALAACRGGDTLVVTKLDRLARSLRDAKDIVDELTRREVKLSIGGSVHDPTDPVGKLLFNVLAMVAEFEADLIRARTREGMAVAKAKGKLRGKQPKLSKKQETHLVSIHRAGTHTTVEIAELFGVARSTVYRAIKRAGDVAG